MGYKPRDWLLALARLDLIGRFSQRDREAVADILVWELEQTPDRPFTIQQARDMMALGTITPAMLRVFEAVHNLLRQEDADD